MSTIAAIKAVLEKKKNTKSTDQSRKTDAKLNSSCGGVLKPSAIPKKPSSAAQSLADAINNARKQQPIKNKQSNVSNNGIKDKISIKTEENNETVEGVKKKGGLFSSKQVERLEKEFARKSILNKDEREKIASELGMSDIQVRVWFQNRRRKNGRLTIDRQNAKDENPAYKKLRSVEVSALQPLADIILMSQAQTIRKPEVVDILDDSLESDEDISLLESTPAVLPSSPVTEEVLSKKEKSKAKKPIKENKKIDTKQVSRKEEEKSKQPEPKHCTREEDLVEELLRKIEELEDDLKDKERDLYYTKKDLEANQVTLEGKERVLKTVQESIPRVVSEHKKTVESKDYEILALNIKLEELKKAQKETPGHSSREGGENDNLLKEKESELTLLKDSLSVLQENVKDLEGTNAQYKQDNTTLRSDLKLKDEAIAELKARVIDLKKEKKQVNDNLDQVTNLKEQIDERNERLLELEKQLVTRDNTIKELEKLGIQKDDELKILKYKEKSLTSKESVDQLNRQLEDSRRETLALRDYERQLNRKVSSLECDLYSRKAENESQSVVINRLNEKIKSLQSSPTDFELSQSPDELVEVPTEGEEFVLKSIPCSSPFVVSSRCKKRKMHEDKCDSNVSKVARLDESSHTEPEFETLCAEIETLCSSDTAEFENVGHYILDFLLQNVMNTQ